MKFGNAFYSDYPAKIIHIEDINAKTAYWTLVATETKETRDGTRDEKGNLLRESRLKNITMHSDEQEIWFLIRNKALRLGHGLQYQRYCDNNQQQHDHRPLGKCCMCRQQQETWEHFSTCSVGHSWIQPWLRKAGAGNFTPVDNLTKAMEIEADTMTTVQVEIFSKLRCAWYDMWKAWKNRKLRSRRTMQAMWHTRWKKRLRRAIHIDMLTNPEAAKTKWKRLLRWTGPTWNLNVN